MPKALHISGRRRRGWLTSVLLLAVAASSVATASVPNPTISEPPVGLRGHALWDSWWDLSEVGYEEHEFFVSGTASDTARAQTAPYTTRIIVTRPSDPERFNGAVLLDWVNVTAQFENAVDTVEARQYLLREGWAYVHVSAQAAGICCAGPFTPKLWDPVRYEALSHPGDAFASNIFSQVAQAIRSPQGIDPLGGLPGPRTLIAAGQSQSASRLDSYVRSEQPQAGLIDAFLIHGGGGKDHGEAGPAAPVLHLLSDLEANASAPTSETNYRLWEIAGSAHSDFWIGYAQVAGQGPRWATGLKRSKADADALDAVAGNYGEQLHPMLATCIVAGAAFPMRYAVNAALDHLLAWVDPSDPVAPPTGPRFEFAAGTLARDQHGNALGGIRLPPIDVPAARYVSTSCGLGGITVPFTEAELLALYPTHDAYYQPMVARTADAVEAGYLLPEDSADLLARACAMKNRWLEPAGPCV